MSGQTPTARRLAMRTCDHCGGRVAPFLPRKRLDSGDLVCRGCENRAQQTKDLEQFRVSVLDTGAFEPITVWAGSEWGEALGRAREETGSPEDRRVIVQAKVSAGGSYETVWPVGTGSLQTMAHDSGDGVTIYHCPFDGSGAVVARSDGSAQCSFCNVAFTVSVQPEVKATPQTIDGVPHVHPDLPGTSPDVSPAPAVDPPQQAPVPDPTQQAAPDPAKPDPAKPKHLPPWLQDKKSSALYLTAEGGALPEDAYLRHLAIRYADDRKRVLDVITARDVE